MADEQFQKERAQAEVRPASSPAEGNARLRRPGLTRNQWLRFALAFGALSFLCLVVCCAAPWGLVQPEDYEWLWERGTPHAPTATKPAGVSEEDWSKERERQLRDFDQQFSVYQQVRTQKIQDYERRRATAESRYDICMFAETALGAAALVFVVLAARRSVRNAAALTAFGSGAFALLALVAFLTVVRGGCMTSLRTRRASLRPRRGHACCLSSC